MAKYTKKNVTTGNFIGWDACYPGAVATEATLECHVGVYLSEADAEIFGSLKNDEHRKIGEDVEYQRHD